jgi:acetyl-CoA carboxylase biotin carboxyl carrier protein
MAIVDVPAPMAGTVWEIVVAAGATVSEGDELIILESMKMEIPLEAPVSGTVKEIAVADKAPFAEGDVLVRIET